MPFKTLILQAQQLIASVRGKKLVVEERINQSVQLASYLLQASKEIQTYQEKLQQQQLAAMVKNPLGKIFTTTLTDQCFRSHRSKRIADQLIYVISKYGIPSYLPVFKRLSLKLFAICGKLFSTIAVPLTVHMIRHETRSVILPGEEKDLMTHIASRTKKGVKINLNHLGEAILGEEEAHTRLQIYLQDLQNPVISYISIKISTIYSQINLLAWEESLEHLAERLRLLYRCAIHNPYQTSQGPLIAKFVNLDMEEYRDLHLTVALFCKVLDEPEFYQYEAGIVLQSYLPDSYAIQQQLTQWAIQRKTNGGAAIKIRLVKGANLAMEQFESQLRLWPQAPYQTKLEVDANYKRMMHYACMPEHAQAVHTGIGSHNLFDIAYGLILRAENQVEKEVSFEMLEGMADHTRRVVQQLAGSILLYCPAAKKEEFQNAVAYLVRRLDENTAPENFLCQSFDLKLESPEWNEQVHLFNQSCQLTDSVSSKPQRQQNRLIASPSYVRTCRFENEPDTDWTLPQNRQWIKNILTDWKTKQISPLPLVIKGQHIFSNQEGSGIDPSLPGSPLYYYTFASMEQIDQAIQAAKEAEIEWSQTSIQERCQLLFKIADELKNARGNLIGVMLANTGKTVQEGDVEVSEAIDFADYYARNFAEWQCLTDIQFKSKGTVLVAPPWNFPCSISTGGILAALVTGNCVLFKPPAEAVLVGWELVQIFWKAGVSPHVLQFITCEDDPVGSYLITRPQISTIVLTGATETAQLFLNKRPDLDLIAETGGKNTLVITGLADRDLAIKDLIQSAFGHAGQKCSACSLAILEAEVYDDPHFRRQLRDATVSLPVGSAWDLKTKVNPLIHIPGSSLLKGLTELESGEEWLLKPQQDSLNPNVWSPGIKLGVKPTSFTFRTELFGPVLGLVRADTIDHAFELMNQTPYGLTAGLHSLDEREHQKWLEHIEAGNCYINRTITGAIVERQPFGGCKKSSFGKGWKAGGPNYLLQFMHAEQQTSPLNTSPFNEVLIELTEKLKNQNNYSFDFLLWETSLASYAFYWTGYFSQKHDPMQVRGQDNLQTYVPHRNMLVRGQLVDSYVDILRVIAAALTIRMSLIVSLESEELYLFCQTLCLPTAIQFYHESQEIFHLRLTQEQKYRIRLLSLPSPVIQMSLAQAGYPVHLAPVLANGRLELLHHLREVSISKDYHRYGNLGERENEQENVSCKNKVNC